MSGHLIERGEEEGGGVGERRALEDKMAQFVCSVLVVVRCLVLVFLFEMKEWVFTPSSYGFNWLWASRVQCVSICVPAADKVPTYP